MGLAMYPFGGPPRTRLDRVGCETPKRNGRVRERMTEQEGTFLVTHVDEGSAVLKNVESGQVHTVEEPPGLEAREVIEGSIAAEPPMEITYRLIETEERRRLSVEESSEPPTQQEREIAAEQSVGEITRHERAGIGELHVLTVPDERTDEAIEDVVDDEATLVRAARLGVNRVEIRSDPGVISVRYLP